MTDDAELKGMLTSLKEYFGKENPLKVQLDNMAGEMKGKEEKIKELEEQIRKLRKRLPN